MVLTSQSSQPKLTMTEYIFNNTGMSPAH